MVHGTEAKATMGFTQRTELYLQIARFFCRRTTLDVSVGAALTTLLLSLGIALTGTETN